jgi:selenocysteine lyase/cysteine desulfurase
VRRVVELAHNVGALCYIDAVQYAPHKPIDVQALNCDFLACSAYKFFGPHTGILYGKYELLDSLRAYKVRPAGNEPPDKFETGTQSFESIAGVLAAIEYFTWIGTTFGQEFAERYQSHFNGRRLVLKQAMAAIEAYEIELNQALLKGFSTIPGLHVWGITDLDCMNQRVPTFSFTLKGWPPRAVAEALDKKNIYVWDGNYYALAVMERLELEEQGGMVRVGAVHYNTRDEVARLVGVLQEVVATGKVAR